MWLVLGSWGWGKLTKASGLLKCFHMPPALPKGLKDRKWCADIHGGEIYSPTSLRGDGWWQSIAEIFPDSVELCHLALLKNTKGLCGTNSSMQWWLHEVFQQMLLHVYFPQNFSIYILYFQDSYNSNLMRSWVTGDKWRLTGLSRITHMEQDLNRVLVLSPR